jgi:outer membrane protein assembly factor BamA
MKFRLLPLLLVLPSLGAQVSADKSKIVIDDVDLQGAVHLPESAKRQLVVDLMHREYPENSEWVADVEDKAVRAETEGWPDRENQGYIEFSVRATFKTLRQEPGLRHVLVTIQLNEDKQKRLKGIGFRFVATQPSGPSFDTASLRKLIPLNDGEVYNRDKFHSGLDAVMHAYQGRGFVDFTSNVESQVDNTNQTVEFVVELNSGKQYRWGNLQVVGLDPKMEMLLKTQLKMGSPVNPKLIEDFYRDNKSALPVGASPKNVKWQYDRERATVDLTFDLRRPSSL